MVTGRQLFVHIIVSINNKMEKNDLPENKFRDFIQHNNKAKWSCENNHNITYFTEDEIRAMTKNYSTKIGSGAFGDVYRGAQKDGQLVAVKRNIRATTKRSLLKK